MKNCIKDGANLIQLVSLGQKKKKATSDKLQAPSLTVDLGDDRMNMKGIIYEYK
jgi:hypothetical protein